MKNIMLKMNGKLNDINQIAHRANETGNIYRKDVEELRQSYDEIWAQTKVILRKLAEI